MQAAAQIGDWTGTLNKWHEFSATTTSFTGFPPHDGVFAEDANGDAVFSDHQIYLWAFKTINNQAPSSWSDVLEYGVFLNTSDNEWTFPRDTTPPSTPIIDVEDTGVFAYQGHGGIVNFNYVSAINGTQWEFTSLQLAAVPEPGVYALVTGVGLLLFAFYRKQLVKS